MSKKQKKGTVKKVVVIVIVIIILIFLLASIIGGQVYMKKDEKKKKEAPGNAESYNLENIEAKSDSPLKGKNIFFWEVVLLLVHLRLEYRLPIILERLMV